MAPTPVRVYEIDATSVTTLVDGEWCFESVTDSDLGWKMTGGKNYSSETVKFLGKDKNARVDAFYTLGSTVLNSGKQVGRNLTVWGDHVSIPAISSVGSTGFTGLGVLVPSVRLDVLGDSSLNGALTVNSSQAAESTIIYGNSATPALFVQGSSGRVGLGTSTPETLLDVEGNVYIGSATAGQAVLRWENTDRKWEWYARTTDFSIYDRTGSSYAFTILNNHNIGIGTQTPAAKLHVVGDATLDGSLTVNSSQAGKDTIIYGNSATPALFVDGASRNIGFGIASPQSYYHFSGNATLDGDARYINLIDENFTYAVGRGGGVAFGIQGRVLAGCQGYATSANDASFHIQTELDNVLGTRLKINDTSLIVDTDRFTIDSAANVTLSNLADGPLIEYCNDDPLTPVAGDVIGGSKFCRDGTLIGYSRCIYKGVQPYGGGTIDSVTAYNMTFDTSKLAIGNESCSLVGSKATTTARDIGPKIGYLVWEINGTYMFSQLYEGFSNP